MGSLLETLKSSQEFEANRRNRAIEDVGDIINFLKGKDGLEWLKTQIRKRGNVDLGRLDDFRSGRIGAVVLCPNYEINDSIPKLPDDVRLVVEGTKGKVSEVYFASRIDVYYPQIRDGNQLTYQDLSNLAYQKEAKARAMDKAFDDHSIQKGDPDYKAVIFCTQTTDRNNTFGCMVIRTYSPEKLVDRLGVESAERLYAGFMDAVKKGQ